MPWDWIKRGPTGVIASNRPDGVAAAAHIRADLGAGGKPGREALATLLAKRQVRVVSYANWQKIEAAEVAAATPPAPAPQTRHPRRYAGGAGRLRGSTCRLKGRLPALRCLVTAPQNPPRHPQFAPRFPPPASRRGRGEVDQDG